MAKSLTSLIAEKNKWLKHDNLPDPKAAKPETKESVTVDPEKSAELKSNIQAKKDAEEFSKVDESGMKKNAMQAKRDQEEFSDAAEVPSLSQIRADAAKRKMELYQNSEEKKKNAEQRLQDQFSQQLLYGITDSSEVLFEEGS